MNTSLLSSHLHGSRIFVSSFCDSTSRRIQKSTYHEPDFSSITREYEGYSWYSLTCSKANVCLPPPTIKQTKYYMRASIPFLDGDLLSDLPPSHIGYSLDLSVLHYIEVWGKEGNSNHMHGDLSYANIIQNNDNVFFIDWEHFLPNAAYFSFDALHLLLETLLIFKRRGALSTALLMCAATNINILRCHPLANSKYFKNPFLSLRSFMEQNIQYWSPQVLKCKSKFPVLTENKQSLFELETTVIKLLK